MKASRKSAPKVGLVEQAQIVASTAVVVAMGTITTVHFVTGSRFTLPDFISILTVGVIGFSFGTGMAAERPRCFAGTTNAFTPLRSVSTRTHPFPSNILKKVRAQCPEHGCSFVVSLNTPSRERQT